MWSFGSAKLGLVGFGCISGSFKFAIGGGNLARFWPKSSQISTNLAESIKIWPIFLHILRDLAEISLYLSRSSHYISGILNLDLLVFHRNTRLEPRSHYICRWMFKSSGSGSSVSQAVKPRLKPIVSGLHTNDPQLTEPPLRSGSYQVRDHWAGRILQVGQVLDNPNRKEIKLENLKIHFLKFHLTLFIIYIYI